MRLPDAEAIISKKIKNLYELYSELPKDFHGAVSLIINKEEEKFKGNILIRNGTIVCVTVENLDTKETKYGESALEDIKKMSSVYECNADVYSLDETTMNSLIDSNKLALVKTPIRSQITKTELDEEFNKLDEEWKSLEKEWERIRTYKDGRNVNEIKSEIETKGKDEKLDIKPKMIRNIKLIDKIRLLKFPRASEIINLFDGTRTLREICVELNINNNEIIPLLDELRRRGYIKE